jgi:hypothetical protein
MMTETEAFNLAKGFASSNGWTWLEPIAVTKKRCWFHHNRWIVRSNLNSRGMNVRIEIDDATGNVVRAAYLPR